MLIQQFRYDNYRLHQLGNNSVFTITLQAGLSAIKTPYPTWLSLHYTRKRTKKKKKKNSTIADVLALNLHLAFSQCYKEDGTSKNPDCPVCSKSLNKLAQPLPMAHCANSRLVCKISGEVMNENNPPMMLPNGYVYGYNVSTEQACPCNSFYLTKALSSRRSQSLLSIRQDDKVVCPRTKEVFNFSQAEKVYIM